MHVIYVTAELPGGPVETYIVPEIVELQRRGYQVTVVPVRLGPGIHSDMRRLAGCAIEKSLLSIAILAAALAEIVTAPVTAIQAALTMMSSRNAVILLKNLLVLPKGLWLAGWARRNRVTHIHAHFASTSATIAFVASGVSGIPWSFTAHRWDISENNLIEKKIEAAKFARAIDARGREELATYSGEYRHKVRMIHMGVVVDPLTAIAGVSAERLRVLIGARFVEIKGHRYAIEAMARLKSEGANVSLECVGDGPLKKAMAKYARSLDLLDCVHFPGIMDHADLLTRLRNGMWDVALLPSIETDKHREGIPVFLMEAMAAGIPVIATNTGGTPELLQGGAGMLIQQRNAAAIAEGLTKLAADVHLRRQLSTEGLRRVRAHFEIESTVGALLNEMTGENAIRGMDITTEAVC